MSLLSKLFGGGNAKPSTPAEEHNGFRIFPNPTSESGGFRVAARIEKDVNGETKTHAMIRADVCQSMEEATATSLRKAKQVIDEQGEAIFR